MTAGESAHEIGAYETPLKLSTPNHAEYEDGDDSFSGGQMHSSNHLESQGIPDLVRKDVSLPTNHCAHALSSESRPSDKACLFAADPPDDPDKVAALLRMW